MAMTALMPITIPRLVRIDRPLLTSRADRATRIAERKLIGSGNYSLPKLRSPCEGEGRSMNRRLQGLGRLRVGRQRHHPGNRLPVPRLLRGVGHVAFDEAVADRHLPPGVGGNGR